MSAEPDSLLKEMKWGEMAAAEEAEPAAQASPEPEDKPEPKQEAKPEAVKEEPSAEQRAEQLQAALHEARMQAREAKDASDRLRGEMEQREQRMADYVRQVVEKNKEPENKPPSLQDDPVAHLAWQNEQLQQRLNSLEQVNQSTAQQSEAQARFNALAQQITSQEQDFARKHPDYYQATQHVKDHGRMLLEAQGYPPEQIPQQLAQWGSSFGWMQLNAGKNAAEQYYALAQKLGYQPPEAGEKQQGAAKPDNLEQIAAGQKQAGMGSGGGAVSTEAPTQDNEFPLLTAAMREMGLV